MKKTNPKNESVKRPLRLEQFFRNDTFVIVFSIVIAVIVWFCVYLAETPDSNRVINDVPVTISYDNSTAKDLGLQIIGDSQFTVNVTVTGTAYAVSKLSTDDFIASIPLSSVTKAGEYTLPVEVIRRQSSSEYVITSWSLKQVTLRFDKVVTKQFPIEISTPKLSAAEGYLMESPYVDVDSITVRGPQTDINKIDRCVITIPNEEELSESMTVNGDITLLDQAGAAIDTSELEMESTALTVTIPIYKTKNMPVKVEFINLPKGFPIDSLKYTLSQSSILVASPSETIDNLESITVGPVDFRTIDIGTTVSLDVVLNAGFKNVEGVHEITVTFPSYGLSSKTMDLKNFVFENTPGGYDVDVIPQKLSNVKVIGETSLLADLTSDDLVGAIDLSQYTLSRGQYNVAVKVYVQGKVLAWAVGEYSVDISVREKE